MTTDNAGNSFTSATITVTVDNTVPTLSVNVANPVNAATSDPTPLDATATDAGSGIANVSFEQCTVANDDSCAVDTWTSLGVDTTPPYGVSWAIPADGTRLLRVRATDNAGRQTAELVLTTVDRTRPTGTVTVPAAGANLRGTSVALSAIASDTAPGTVNTVTFQRSPAGAGTWTDISVDSSPPYNATLDTTGLATASTTCVSSRPTRPETPRRRPPRCRCGSTTRSRRAPSPPRPTLPRFAARSR